MTVDRDPPWRVAAEVCAMAAVAAATFWYRFLSFTQFSNDHFVHLAVGQQMARGAWPVRDFVERGAPLMSFVSALGQRWLGDGLRSELVIVLAALAAASALCVFVFTRLSGSLAIGIVLALAPTLIYPLSYSYPKLLLYAAVPAAVWIALRRPSVGWQLLLAIVLAAAFLFRHDHGLFLGLGVATAMLAWHGAPNNGVAGLRRVAGVAMLLIAPFLLWVQWHEGLGTYLSDSAAFARREAERASWSRPAFALASGKPIWAPLREGPIVNVRWDPQVSEAVVRQAERRHGLTRHDPAGPRSWQYALSDWSPAAIERLVRDPAAADTHGIDRSTFALEVPAPTGFGRLLTRLYGPADGARLEANAVTAFYYAVWLLPALVLAGVVATWHRCAPELRAVALMTVVVQLAVDATMLREPLGNRIRDVIVPAAALMALVAGALWKAPGPAVFRVGARATTVVLLVAFTVCAGAIGEAGERTSELMANGFGGLQRRARAVNYRLSPPQHRTGGELAPGYLQLVSYVRRCTPERSRLLALTFVPELFIYTGREFAGGHVMFNPGYYVEERHAALILERLAREDVPLVILDAETRAEMAATYPRVWDHVARRYRQAGEFMIRPGRTLVVLADTTRPRRGQFEGTALPCFAATASG